LKNKIVYNKKYVDELLHILFVLESRKSELSKEDYEKLLTKLDEIESEKKDE